MSEPQTWDLNNKYSYYYFQYRLDNHRIVKSAAINLSSRTVLGVLGFLQLVLIAKFFGISISTDAYMVAIWIPMFMWGLGDSVLTYSLVPYLVSLNVKEGRQQAKRAADKIFTWFFLILSGSALFMFITAPYLVNLLVPGFTKEAHTLTIELFQLLSPVILLAGLTSFATSLLYTMNKFTIPAITALFPEIGAISFLLLSARLWGIKAMAFGFMFGVFVQLVVILLALSHIKLLPKFCWSSYNEFSQVSKLIGPRLGGVGLNRAVIGVDRFFASMLGAGSVSVLAYSFRLTQLPVKMVVAAFGKTLMPTLSSEIARGNTDNMLKLIPRFIGFVLFIIAPVVLLMIYYSETIIRIIYQRGAFTSEDTLIAAKIVVYYSISILFQSVGIVFSGIFYAFGNTLTAFKITALSLLINAVLDFILMNYFGITGIAMATMGVAVISTIILCNRLNAHIGKIKISTAFASIIKICIATAVMGFAIWWMTDMLAVYVSVENVMTKIIEVSLLSFLSWLIFLLACRLLKLEEYLAVELIVGRKLGWQK